VTSLAETLDRLVSVEFRRDGALDGMIDPIYRALRKEIEEPLVWRAATLLNRALRQPGVIYITIGQPTPKIMPAGLTDGPPGAAVLARALTLCGSGPVVILTEEATQAVTRAACQAMGVQVRHYQRNVSLPRSVSVDTFPIDRRAAESRARELVAHAVAVIAIDKIGPGRDGRYYTGHGTDISNHLCKVDLLFDAVRGKGGVTIGIGDFGNEIGLGAAAAVMAKGLVTDDRMACTVTSDGPIVAGCGNWGAYGIVAALAAMNLNHALLHAAEEERATIIACCRAGAVDGMSTAPTLEVDGAGWATHAAFVRLLRDLTALAISRKPLDGDAAADHPGHEGSKVR